MAYSMAYSDIVQKKTRQLRENLTWKVEEKEANNQRKETKNTWERQARHQARYRTSYSQIPNYQTIKTCPNTKLSDS